MDITDFLDHDFSVLKMGYSVIQSPATVKRKVTRINYVEENIFLGALSIDPVFSMIMDDFLCLKISEYLISEVHVLYPPSLHFKY